MTHIATNHEIETYTGRYVNTAEPDPATIALEDIAHALAHICRFGGHCGVFYSVAEHAVGVADKLVAQGYGELALAGLHHDDAEAYLGDIPRPLKPLLGDAYRDLTVRMDAAIATAFDLWEVGDLAADPVQNADEWMLRVEALSLLRSRGEGWSWRPTWRVLAPQPLGWSPTVAAREFIQRHESFAEHWA